MKVQAVIPVAGTGSRFRSKVLKPFVLLDGKPVLAWTLRAFEKCRTVQSVIVVCNPAKIRDFEKLVARFRIKKVSCVVPGGKSRRESVMHGLRCLDRDTGKVVIHDGARPLVTAGLIDRCVKGSARELASITAVPVKSTIKEVDTHAMRVVQTHKREGLWEVQTPQVFDKDILLRAHRLKFPVEPTDDAMMVERLKVRVKVLPGCYRNIKITMVEDLAIARGLLKFQKG